MVSIRTKEETEEKGDELEDIYVSHLNVIELFSCRYSNQNKHNAQMFAEQQLIGKWLNHGDSSSHQRLQQEASLTIACAWRQLVARRLLQKLKEEAKAKRERNLQEKAAITFQLAWRQVIARKELRRRKKEAKEKLELELQQLKRQLLLEKEKRNNLELTNAQSIAKLQETLRDIQQEVEEANSLFFKEKEAFWKAIEEAIEEDQDSENTDSLTAEIDRLKRLQEAALTCQRAWRQLLARRQLKKLKREAKEKLEKEVEELRSQLQLEKKLRNNLEITNAKSIAKLQEALCEMRIQVEEANGMFIKEKEALLKSIEDTFPVTNGTSDSIDKDGIDSLIVEIGNLKELLQQERKSNSEALQAYAELQEKNEKMAKQLEDAGKEIDELRDSIRRFEEKLSNLEYENESLREQALSLLSTNNNLAESLKPDVPNVEQECGEKLQKVPSEKQREEKKSDEMLEVSPFDKQQEERKVNGKPPKSPCEKQEVELKSDVNPIQSPNDKQQEKEDLLVRCISQEIGFSNGRPIAACVIYKCLLHWGLFEVEKTDYFNHIIQTINSLSDSEAQENNGLLSYWLSNSSMLLSLLQRMLKSGEATSTSLQRRKTPPTSFWGRLSQGMRASPQSVGVSNRGGAGMEMHQIEAKGPALNFKQQLSVFLEKVYGKLRDNAKKEISSVIDLCIQDLKAPHGSPTKGSRSQFSLTNWQSLVKILGSYLKAMNSNYVSPFFVRKMFAQIFSFINMQLFNSLLLQRECCSFSNGEYLKAGLSELKKWCSDAPEVYTGAAWEQMQHINQAVAFLVVDQKSKRTFKEVTNTICPNLDMRQLYTITTMYWDDKSGTQTLSPEVTSSMRAELRDDPKDSDTTYFLLPDDSSMPFSMDDFTKTMASAQIDISNIDPPPLIRQDPAFAFLVPHSE